MFLSAGEKPGRKKATALFMFYGMHPDDEDFTFETVDEYAARREADEMLRAEYEIAQHDAAEAAEADRLRYPGGRCAPDYAPSIYGWRCEVYDPIPF